MKSIDNRAFEILVRQHHRRLFGFALAFVSDPATAEDLVQDAFVTAHAKLDTFDPAGNFVAWMRAIVRFKYLEWCRRRHETALAPETLETLAQRHEAWDQGECDKGPVLDILMACVNALPDVMSRVVDLFYFQEWPGRRIAEHTGENEATIRQRVNRARKLLADCVRAKLREQEGSL